MATAVLFIGWNRPHTGMDDKAYGFLMESMPTLRGYIGKYCERIETIGLTAHFGTMNGCVILFGERAKLDELRRTDEFEAFSMKLDEMFDGFGVVPGVNWEGIQAVMARRQKTR